MILKIFTDFGKTFSTTNGHGFTFVLLFSVAKKIYSKLIYSTNWNINFLVNLNCVFAIKKETLFYTQFNHFRLPTKKTLASFHIKQFPRDEIIKNTLCREFHFVGYKISERTKYVNLFTRQRNTVNNNKKKISLIKFTFWFSAYQTLLSGSQKEYFTLIK